MKSLTLVLSFLLVLNGCANGGDQEPAAGPAEPVDASPAVDALRGSKFFEAEEIAAGLLTRNAGDPTTNAVAALTLYKRTMHDLVLDGISIFAGATFMGSINHRYAAWALGDAESRLTRVAAHLDNVGRDPDFAMEMCLACWQVDWNKNGEIDWRDQRMLEVEVDADGNEIPEGDPRRRPTFHFDVGDIYWAGAMISFQRAALNIVSAYDYAQVDQLFMRMFRGTDQKVATIKIADAARVLAARDLVITGIDFADRARQSYLAETDDVGEWLPNPNQKKHPLPLPVNAALYDTWSTVLRDVKNLISGKEGLDVAALAQLGDHQWEDPPRGYLNISRLFEEPGDLTLDKTHLQAVDRNRARGDVENVLRDVFGNKYVQQMKPSPITATLGRIKGELDRGEESFERKLRYLLWLN